MPGPAPTPNHIKDLLGNPGHDKINRDEPRPTVAKSAPPRSLTDPAARKMYRTLAKSLVPFGLLTVQDTATLAKACDLTVQGDKLWEIYKCEPMTTGVQGAKVVHPAFRAALAAYDAADKILRQFGIGSPAERSRLKAAEAPRKSKWTGLLN
jgi:P27 family predicted phage terminase small subunit